MRKTKYSRQEINEAMLKAKDEAWKVYTFEYIRSIRPRTTVNEKCEADSYEYDKYYELDIDTLISNLELAKTKGARKVNFSTSYDGDEINIEFSGTRDETDAEWATRINRVQNDFVQDAMNKVKREMDAFNMEIEQYLLLKARFGGK